MKALLFTTTTCSKCPAFKAFVAERVAIPVKVLNERDADFGELAGLYDVTAAPTFVVLDAKGGELLKTSEQYEVQDAINNGLFHNS